MDSGRSGCIGPRFYIIQTVSSRETQSASERMIISSGWETELVLTQAEMSISSDDTRIASPSLH